MFRMAAPEQLDPENLVGKHFKVGRAQRQAARVWYIYLSMMSWLVGTGTSEMRVVFYIHHQPFAASDHGLNLLKRRP